MLIIIHSETNKSNIQQNLGRPEYSYYFVLKEFRPVLERLGQVIEVSNPDELVDRLYFDCLSRGEACVFLSFSRRIAHRFITPARPSRYLPGNSAPSPPRAGTASHVTTGAWC
jgi:hypothetical protein